MELRKIKCFGCRNNIDGYCRYICRYITIEEMPWLRCNVWT